jgi:hypothetical protein
MGFALRPWATWCLNALADESGATPEVAKLVHRIWARSAVGKWAQRGFEVLPIGPSPNRGWFYEEAWHHGENVPAGIVDFAGERYQVAAVAQSDNSYPAVLAFVESYVRLALGMCIKATGDKYMVACDTDGYICGMVDDRHLEAANEMIAPLQVRPKRHFKRVKVLGPQHMELDHLVRRSGIPASAMPMRDGKLGTWTWPKLAWQLANGRPGAYVRPHQTYKLAATYASGWVLADGSVVPVELRIGTAGHNEVVPWPETRYAARGCVLGPDQNQNLVRLTHAQNQSRH